MSLGVIEMAWNEYKQLVKKDKIINGKKYYKIVYSDSIFIAGRGRMITVVIPYSIIDKENISACDELDNRFELKGPEIMSFSDGNIPEWYLKAGAFYIDNIDNNFCIGKYISFNE